MNGSFPAHLLPVLIVGLASAGSAAAGGTATDQAVSLTYSATHWTASPNADLAGVDATGDPLYQAGWWYRAEGDTREYRLPAPDSEVYADGWVTATWNNLDGKDFKVIEHVYVADNEGPSGGFVANLIVANNGASPRQFWAFHYLDADMAASSTGDSGALVSSAFIKLSEGTSRVSYRADNPTHYQVAAYPAVRDELNDTGLDDLNDTGLPFGPGDASAAFQFGGYPLEVGANVGVGTISAFFNPASDYFKGDDFGVLGQSPLLGQKLDLSNRFYQPMRRATRLGVASFGGPTASSFEGIDDFDGDFKGESVSRNPLNGVTYVNVPITGAPTLALNWKLSATGDFDHDGKADILWRNTVSQKLVIWLMNGSAKVGSLIPTPDQAVNANWEVAAAADFSGDGQRDLLWYNQTTGKIVLWYMDASVVRITGLFTTPASVGNNNWRARAAADIGKGPGGVYNTQDIVWQNDTSKKVVVWFMDQAANRTGGVFTTPDTLSGGGELVGPR